MGSTISEVGGGIVRRRNTARVLGVFIDGTGLDHACKRLNRRVDMKALLRGVTSGITPVVARYYTIVPNEDDSRHRAYLDAVSRAGFSVIVKRLPPKGVARQVAVDVEMAADIVAFGCGHSNLETELIPKPENDEALAASPKDRAVVVVCPSRDIAYPLGLIKSFGADTTTADFAQFNSGDILKSAAKWIDLSHSETIWKEERSAG